MMRFGFRSGVVSFLASAMCAVLLPSAALVQQAEASVRDGASAKGDGWYASPWFGSFYDAGNGWLYGDKWGWIYEVDGGTGRSWFYAADESAWFWTANDFYPWVYRYSDSKWLDFWKDTTNPRSYYDPVGKTWLASDSSDGALWHDYYGAIVDAETGEYDEISHNLTAINSHNTALSWNHDRTMIRVVSWMTPKHISSYVAGQNITPTWEIWITVRGAARSAAVSSGLRGDALALRMRQYLGLPPDGDYEYWVEFWVKPSDLYRPSADPAPGDCEAELDFDTSPETTVSESYMDWFYANKSASYVLTRNGYPWTRLGYTYDWRAGANEVGLSEFVIRPGATVTIVGVFTNDEYLEE
jgi:hypothetical protein